MYFGMDSRHNENQLTFYRSLDVVFSQVFCILNLLENKRCLGDLRSKYIISVEVLQLRVGAVDTTLYEKFRT